MYSLVIIFGDDRFGCLGIFHFKDVFVEFVKRFFPQLLFTDEDIVNLRVIISI